tara:strand:+ start:1480 stop:1809 length:330 start_codon:yes stop_codon:yes gene_type:complete
MAMISCPECTTEVSDNAASCPKCGVQLRKPTRSIMGKVFKWVFILFNLLMAFSLYNGMQGAGEVMQEMDEGAQQAGAAVGTAIGVTFLLGIWFVGDVILGLFVLFTRPK